MGIKDDDLLPEERALMNGTAAEDEPQDEPDAVAAAGVEDEAAEGAAEPASTEPAAEAKPDAEAETEAAAAEPAKPAVEASQAYEVADTKAIADQRKTLRAEKAGIEAKWASGELSDEDRAAKIGELDDQLDTLLIEQTRAETLREANAQRAMQDQVSALKRIAATAKGQGIDYADDGMGAMYDAKLRAVAADPAFAGKAFEDVAAEAHARVLKAIGRDPAAPTPTPTPAPTPAKRESPRANIPPTLGAMPAAAAQPVGDELAAQIDAITDPDELERRWAALPASKRTSMLRSTVRQ